MRTLTFLALGSALSVLPTRVASTQAGRPAPSPAPTIAIRGSTVLPMTGAAIPNGTVLMRGGKIVAVGARASVDVPADAMVVDATGKYVMPGLIDAMTYYGIDAQDLAETAEPITPELHILDAYDPTGEGFASGAGPLRAKELLVGGVTSQYVGPGDATIVSGQGAIVKTAGPNMDALVLRPVPVEGTMVSYRAPSK